MFSHSKLKLILKILALAPSSQKESTQRVLNSFSLITIISVVLSAIFGFTLDVFGDGYIVSSLATSVVFIGLIVGHLAAVLESLVKREKHDEFFEKLYELDDFFRVKVGYTIPVASQSKKLNGKYSIITLVVFVSLLIYIGSILTHTYEGFFWHGSISVIVSRIRCIQASVYVDLFNLRFRHLNKVLKQLASSLLKPSNQILDINLCDIDNPKRIIVIKSIYRKLYDLVTYLNDAFGWSILTFTVYFCLDFTCNCYWLILAWDDYLPSYHNHECFFTVCPIVLLMTSYCYICSECMRMSDNTKLLVQKMLVTSNNDHTNDLLNAFLMQINNQPIFIHAKMFFRVNLKLLTSVS
ncbi:putative gustatory receptor 39b [Eupeodes corollae]|uniref:putative gustatory receptor 39b n=1 Tax=Eupeodes corollae TaxID=290404 RepID=UPI00249295C9|nr:putative gustatory receptor 39b [Eupeodes corollae]